MQRGADVLYQEISKVHVSGHASRDEMKLMINLVRPKFMVPVHGELRHLREHGKLAESLGIPRRNIAVIENGTILEFDAHNMHIGERIPGGYIFVDGIGVGDVGPSVMRDRELLAESGFFVTAVRVNEDGRLIGKPEIVSRGFVYLSEAQELLDGAEELVANTVEGYDGPRERLARKIEDNLRRYLHGETGRRPVIYALVK
jgi:ribonuclease J